jgi:hypothetical protein
MASEIMDITGGVSEAPQPQEEQPSQSFVVPLQRGNTIGAKDDEEWEYEYSDIETETFYLTLDLTTPSIPTSRPRVPNARNGRGGARPKWINPGLGRHKRQLGRAPTISSAQKDGSAAGGNEGDESGDEAADPAAPRVAGDGENGEAQKDGDEYIQILDLESDNPLVTYRDHVFTCQWAQNIGTELLFATHEDNHGELETLRRLPNNVDLLAAISSRITSTTATVVPKSTRPHQIATEATGPLVESVSAAASEERKSQARFLESLMAIKARKKEKDEVTVVAYKRLRFHGWAELMRKKREEERIRLRQMLWAAGRAEAEEAQKRLDELDELDKMMPSVPPGQYDEDEEEENRDREVVDRTRRRRRRKRKENLWNEVDQMTGTGSGVGDGQYDGSSGVQPAMQSRVIKRRPRGGAGSLLRAAVVPHVTSRMEHQEMIDPALQSWGQAQAPGSQEDGQPRTGFEGEAHGAGQEAGSWRR